MSRKKAVAVWKPVLSIDTDIVTIFESECTINVHLKNSFLFKLNEVTIEKVVSIQYFTMS